MEINVFRFFFVELSSVPHKQKRFPMLRHANVKTFGGSLLALVLFGTATLPTDIRAQVTGGSISGTVADSTGRVIAGAQIEITNPATGISRAVTTNAEG